VEVENADNSSLRWSPCTFDSVLKPGTKVGTIRPLLR
jgi:hypothetical protein